MIQKVGNKNIYIIGWDILESNLDILENNAKRLDIDIFDRQRIKTIDLRKLADLALPIDEIGRIGPDTALFWLEKKVSNSSDNDAFKLLAGIRNARWQKTFCTASIDMDLMLLKLFMQHLSLHTVDEVYAWLEAPHKVEVLPFGKHKGELLADVYVKDNEYLCWLHSCKDIMERDKDLKFTLDELLNDI